MANILIKQGREIAGSSLVNPSTKADKVDLTSIIQTGTTSSQAISSGTYFYLNDVLVKAKVDIANGATFTLNTNYEVVTAGALNELKDSGWKSLNTYVKYRKVGKVVTVHTSFIDSVITTTGWAQFGTLPSGYRPYMTMLITPYNDNNYRQIVRIADNGAITVNGNVSSNACFTYLAD